MKLTKTVLAMVFVVVAVVLLGIAYGRSGTTFQANVGFGGPSITLRKGTFYYDWISDIGLIDRAAGFARSHNGEVNLSPLGLLSSNDLPPFLTEPLLRVRCGEREYLIPESGLTSFREWEHEYGDITDPIFREMQPYMLRVGDVDRAHGECMVPEREST